MASTTSMRCSFLVLFSTLEQYNLVFVEDGDGLIRHSRGVVRRDGLRGYLRDVQNHWSTVFGIDSNGAMVIRPDGFIAWRARDTSGEPAAAPTERARAFESPYACRASTRRSSSLLNPAMVGVHDPGNRRCRPERLRDCT